MSDRRIHDVPVARRAREVKDKRVLLLIHRYLTVRGPGKVTPPGYRIGPSSGDG